RCLEGSVTRSFTQVGKLPQSKHIKHRLELLAIHCQVNCAGSYVERSYIMASIEKAFGYQANNMDLPVADLATAVPFYENVLGFRVVSRSDTPLNSAVLERDEIQIRLAENGGDPTQDGCAFHVKGLKELFAEFRRNGD